VTFDSSLGRGLVQHIKVRHMRFLTTCTIYNSKMTVFWDGSPCSLVEVYRCFRGACYDELLIALMMETASTSETSINFYQTTRRNIPEDSHLHFATVRTWNLTNFQLVLIILWPCTVSSSEIWIKLYADVNEPICKFLWLNWTFRPK
jgi:hypothetical protein